MEEVQLDLKRKEDLVMRKKLRACSSSPIRQVMTRKLSLNSHIDHVSFRERVPSFWNRNRLFHSLRERNLTPPLESLQAESLRDLEKILNILLAKKVLRSLNTRQVGENMSTWTTK